MAKKPIQITRRNSYSKLLVILMCIAIIPGLLISALAYYVSIQNAKKEAVTYSTQFMMGSPLYIDGGVVFGKNA